MLVYKTEVESAALSLVYSDNSSINISLYIAGTSLKAIMHTAVKSVLDTGVVVVMWSGVYV